MLIEWNRFNYFHMDIQLFQQHLLKRLSPLDSLGTLIWKSNVHIYVDLFWDYLPWCLDPSTYPCAITCVFLNSELQLHCTPNPNIWSSIIFYICLGLETFQSPWCTCNSILVVVIVIKCLLCARIAVYSYTFLFI